MRPRGRKSRRRRSPLAQPYEDHERTHVTRGTGFRRRARAAGARAGGVRRQRVQGRCGVARSHNCSTQSALRNEQPAEFGAGHGRRAARLVRHRLGDGGRKTRRRDRPLQAAPENRRRRLRRRVDGRAGGAGAAARGAEGDQARDGHEGGRRALRSRAAGAGDDGSSEHREGARCRRDGYGPARSS